MKKLGVFAATILILSVIAGLYGIIHNQITFSLSPEYFTKFKYRLFGINPLQFGGHRQAVGIIGFLSSCWVGAIVGVSLGLAGFVYPDHNSMRHAIIKATIIIFLVAIGFAVIGFFCGKYHLLTMGVQRQLPADVNDRTAFVIVGSIHNFSYLGGLTGLLISLIFMVRKARSLKRTQITKLTKF